MVHPIQAKLLQLLAHKREENLMEREIQKQLSEYIAKNRQFKDGEVVGVYDAECPDKLLHKGVVAGVKTCIGTEQFELSEYESDEKFDRDINDIRYEIFALKNNGCKSEKHLFNHPHFIGTTKKYSTYIIKKLEE